MHRFLLIVAATAVLLMLGACASPASRSDTAMTAVDAGKVVAVDQWAKRKHATVMWVHYPQTAATASSGAETQ
jgi:hypothetical protein